jgi:hypothetical protein
VIHIHERRCKKGDEGMGETEGMREGEAVTTEE